MEERGKKTKPDNGVRGKYNSTKRSAWSVDERGEMQKSTGKQLIETN